MTAVAVSKGRHGLRLSAGILEIEGGEVRRFMAYFDTRDLTPQVVS
jgi:hypothetical protein